MRYKRELNFYRGVFIANASNEELYRSLFLFIFKFLKGQQALLTNDTNIILVDASFFELRKHSFC